MTDLKKLKVSLTKHGAHKLAYLVTKFDKDDIVNHINGDYNDINIDHVQTRKILSIDENDVAPEFWNEIKKFGEEDIFDLVFFAIVLSHHELIDTMIQAHDDNSEVIRDKVIGGKAYSNFARILTDLKISVHQTPTSISFDISRVFYKFYLTRFIYELLGLKLIDAGWDKSNNLIEESLRLSLNKVFNLSSEDFKLWLEANNKNVNFANRIRKPKRSFEKGFNFIPGHNTKFSGTIEFEVSTKRIKQLLHNKIQNEVFLILSEKFPKDEIGTEIMTNVGSVDMIRRSHNHYYFYEIKTAKNIKSSIRQAIAQLLEYAYWNEIENVKELIVIAPNKPTKAAKRYLSKLRDLFNIPIYYRYYDPVNSKLHNKI